MKLPTAALLFIFHRVNGHGFLKEPKSRNYYAYSNGQDYCSGNNCDSVPKRDYDYVSLNENEVTTGAGVVSACGMTQQSRNFDYNSPMNAAGGDLLWNTQQIYSVGQDIDVEVILTAHHEGFFEFFVCDDIFSPTKDCFDQHPLEFVSDYLYSAQKQSNEAPYNRRAYIPPANLASYQYASGGKQHRYKMRLPLGVSGNVLVQWRYTTGNTCYPDHEYELYVNQFYTGNGWGASAYAGLPFCDTPMPDRARTPSDPYIPERFWNCAEINIGGGEETIPIDGPETSGNSIVGGGEGCCGDGFTGSQAANNCDGSAACVNGINYGYVACPSGLKFNVNLGVCDWPTNVHCHDWCQT